MTDAERSKVSHWVVPADWTYFIACAVQWRLCSLLGCSLAGHHLLHIRLGVLGVADLQGAREPWEGRHGDT